MSIRNRLAFLFTAIVSVLLAYFCLLIYLVADQHRRDEFRGRLRAEALTAGHLLFGSQRVSPILYKLMDKNQLTVLPREEIVIYSDKNQLIYQSGTEHIDVQPATLDRVRRVRELSQREGVQERIGILFTEGPLHLVIFASAVDTYGIRTVQDLALILSIGWGLMTLLMLVAGRFFAGKALQPIGQINQRIDEITASQLALRLPEGASADELTQLAQRVNRMLNRLEDAFRMQRAFVSHASHELRTPLTAITGQLEVSLLADDEPDELRNTLRSVLDDVRGLNRLTNGLLALTSASMDPSAVPLAPVQLDALLRQVQTEVQRLYPAYTIDLQINPPTNPTAGWQLLGSEALLRTTLYNLMENGGKFSTDHRVTVKLFSQDSALQLTVHNSGASIPADQLREIFTPFRRGRNASGLPGHGIGLSLIERIVQLHQGRITVESSAEAGTLFTVTLPRS